MWQDVFELDWRRKREREREALPFVFGVRPQLHLNMFS